MTLVLNCGSQSIKYKVFSDNLKLLESVKVSVPDQAVFKEELAGALQKIKKYEKEIKVVGHRVVHGGEKFRQPTMVTPKVLQELAAYNKFAPLHNPYNILGVVTASETFPKAKQVAVFDTGFYKDLPQVAFTYPLPEKIRKEYGFRKFGFHGISHQYAAEMAAQKLGRPLKVLKLISCHLGGGSSVTAIKNGKAVDTSMGFTPLEGVVMMTRSGDLDPGVVLELAEIFSKRKGDEILNKESGLKSISGYQEMLDILAAQKRGDKKAKLALDIFVYRIRKYIGGYAAILGGCDALVFTGAIGAGSQLLRKMISNGFKTKTVAVEPNEELAIARQIHNLKK